MDEESCPVLPLVLMHKEPLDLMQEELHFYSYNTILVKCTLEVDHFY